MLLVQPLQEAVAQLALGMRLCAGAQRFGARVLPCAGHDNDPARGRDTVGLYDTSLHRGLRGGIDTDVVSTHASLLSTRAHPRPVCAALFSRHTLLFCCIGRHDKFNSVKKLEAVQDAAGKIISPRVKRATQAWEAKLERRLVEQERKKAAAEDNAPP